MKKLLLLFSYLARSWLEYNVSIWSRLCQALHRLLNISSSTISSFKVYNGNFVVTKSIPIAKSIRHYSRFFLHSLTKIREEPQSLFQLVVTVSACLVIFSVVSYSQLSGTYVDHKSYSTTTAELNQSNVQNNLDTHVKKIDNESNDFILTDSGKSLDLEHRDPKEIPKERQESLNTIKIPMIQKNGIRDVTVAILDTGIDKKHEDLADKVVDEIDFTKSGSPNDYNGHGTHIAGIIAADAYNDLGLIGVAPQAELLNVKVADGTGRCKNSVVAAGIVWAVDNGANIINISLEMRDTSKELENAIDYAWENGCIIVAATNLENESLVYPACYEKCIAVAVNRKDSMIVRLVDHGNWVDIAAPGHQIYSTLPHNSYGMRSGASCSTAFVSGIAALLFSTFDDTDEDGKLNDEVRILIESSLFNLSAWQSQLERKGVGDY